MINKKDLIKWEVESKKLYACESAIYQKDKDTAIEGKVNLYVHLDGNYSVDFNWMNDQGKHGHKNIYTTRNRDIAIKMHNSMVKENTNESILQNES